MVEGSDGCRGMIPYSFFVLPPFQVVCQITDWAVVGGAYNKDTRRSNNIMKVQITSLFLFFFFLFYYFVSLVGCEGGIRILINHVLKQTINTVLGYALNWFILFYNFFIFVLLLRYPERYTIYKISLVTKK